MLCGKDYIGHRWRVLGGIPYWCERCMEVYPDKPPIPATSILNGKAIDPDLVVQAGEVI